MIDFSFNNLKTQHTIYDGSRFSTSHRFVGTETSLVVRRQDVQPVSSRDVTRCPVSGRDIGESGVLNLFCFYHFIDIQCSHGDGDGLSAIDLLFRTKGAVFIAIDESGSTHGSYVITRPVLLGVPEILLSRGMRQCKRLDNHLGQFSPGYRSVGAKCAVRISAYYAFVGQCHYMLNRPVSSKILEVLGGAGQLSESK